MRLRLCRRQELMAQLSETGFQMSYISQCECSIKVKQFTEKSTLLLLLVMALLRMAVRLLCVTESLLLVRLVLVWLTLVCLVLWTRRCRIIFYRSVYDLVEFPTVQPNTATVRTVVDFDPLPIRH